MRIDLRKQLYAYGEQMIVSGEKDREAVGILSRRKSEGSIEQDTEQVSERGVAKTYNYNLWLSLCDPSDSQVDVQQITFHGKTYERISGGYDPTFCCYRLIVREVGR